MRASSLTDVGQQRELNEDCVFCSTGPVGNLPNLFVLADGMGGHRAGEIASGLAIEFFCEAVKADEGYNPITIMNRAIQAANNILYEKSQSSDRFRGMGTTLVACSLSEGTLFVSNVGDSRLYVVGESIRQITRDHSLVEELASEGKIERDSTEYLEQKNIITRAVGIMPRVMSDFFELDLEAGEQVLLCSDGLSNMVRDEAIADIVRSTPDTDSAVKSLIEEANRNGGRDNISVILVSPEEDQC